MINPHQKAVFPDKAAISRMILVLVLMCILPFHSLFTQDYVNVIDNERLKLQKEIEKTAILIDKTRDIRLVTLSDLSVLQSSINSRQKLIENYQHEQARLYDTIFSTLIQINTLDEEINLLKAEYARMIYVAYRLGDANRNLLYLVAADDFRQAFNRLNWFRSYTAKRKDQIRSVEQTEIQHMAVAKVLEQKLEQNELLITNLYAESQQLNDDKLRKDRSVAELSKKEKELISKHKQLSENYEYLKRKVEQALAEDAKTGIDSNSSKLHQAEEQELSELFQYNLGKLPWPSEFGIVTSLFGEHQHPDLQRVKIKNNGINIITGKGSKARAVFEGTVTRVMDVPNFHKVVIIRHGEYLTVYSNLTDVSVRQGEQISTKQELGTIFTNMETNKTELHFELWKGKSLLDPLPWLVNQQDAVQYSE